jgi:hypothetical protein
MAKTEMVNPDNYKNLEMLCSVIRYPALNNSAISVNRVATHCQHIIDPSEVELKQILENIKTGTADFMGYLGNEVLRGTGYSSVATDIIDAHCNTSTKINSKYRNMTREEIFSELFGVMNVMKHRVTKEMGVLRHPAEIKKPTQISINAAEYIGEYQKLFATMDGLYDYFAPVADDTQDKTL